MMPVSRSTYTFSVSMRSASGFDLFGLVSSEEVMLFVPEAPGVGMIRSTQSARELTRTGAHGRRLGELAMVRIVLVWVGIIYDLWRRCWHWSS